MSKTGKRIATSALVAGVVGYIAGILTAPKSGKKTREDIKEGFDKSMVEAEKELKKLHTELNNVIDAAKEISEKVQGSAAAKELSDLLKQANQAKEKVREILSALHEGDANDKDLNQAVKDATKALDHLKEYLKKN